MSKFREPCDWWFHGKFEQNGKINKSDNYCANKKSLNHLSRVCPRQTCPDYCMYREEC